MKYGISSLSAIPLRQSNNHRSEMVSQLLFGETYEILRSKEKWHYIKCTLDQYEGWIHSGQHTPLSEKEYHSISLQTVGIALSLIHI